MDTDVDLTSAYDFSLPTEQIAAYPLESRSESRLLALEPGSGTITDRTFLDLELLLGPGDLIVMNDARVINARIEALRETGGRVEVFVIGFGREGSWDDATSEIVALTRATGTLRVGERLRLQHRGSVTITSLVSGRARMRFEGYEDAWGLLDSCGEVPLPSYIAQRRTDAGSPRIDDGDRDRYQTIFARVPGAVAAPTAGLHFTEDLRMRLLDRGIAFAAITLLVGAGTFRPVRAQRLSEHDMHEERFTVPEATARAVAATRERGGRVVAVGTTAVRALESATDGDGTVCAFSGSTDLLIAPGYRFRAVDALITNFHLPRSTLLALVAAFAGYEATMRAYAHAVGGGYRFYSYGDAMFVSGAATLSRP